jgi:3-hydroxyacyl-CoA dehydrogenase
MAFYQSLGKAPVLIKKEVPGFLANRLQAAVLAEAYSLVKNGVASPEDVDTAMSTGPGLRWALAGPYMTNVIGGGGGKEGFSHFMSHLGPAVHSWKDDMDKHSFSFNEDDTKAVSEEVKEWMERSDPDKTREEMGDALLGLLEVKSTRSSLV